ncbi:MAG: AAA family ATPase [Nitrososphaeraceae archaeon]
MIIKKITLNNVRSYGENMEIHIPEGKILFQGDIGSGKSTILSAIEFGLFGLGDIDGNNLIRIGKKKCFVKVDFIMNGKCYTVFRSLVKKGKKVSQDEGYIIDPDNIKTNYSVTELKSKILKIINIKENSQSRATSIIYRFAIFTPQEMMKQILFEPVEKRLEILRRAFNIEEYNFVKNNSELYLRWIRSEARLCGELSKDMEQIIQNKITATKKKFELTKQIRYEQNNLKKIEEKLVSDKKKIANYSHKKDIVLKLQGTIPHKKNLLQKYKNRLKQLHNKKIQLEEEKKEISDKEILLENIKPKYKDYINKRERLRQIDILQEKLQDLIIKREKLSQKIENEKNIILNEIKLLEKEISVENQVIPEAKKVNMEIKILKSKEYKLKLSTSKLKNATKDMLQISYNVSKFQSKIELTEKELVENDKNLLKLRNIDQNSKCPLCMQILSEKHIDKIIKEIEEEKNDQDEFIKYLKYQIDENNSKKKKKIIEIKDFEIQDRELRKIKNDLVRHEEKLLFFNNQKEKLLHLKCKLKENKSKIHDNNFKIIERITIQKYDKEIKILNEKTHDWENLKRDIEKYHIEQIDRKYIEYTQIIKNKNNLERNILEIESYIRDLKDDIQNDEIKLNHEIKILEKNKHVLNELNTIESEFKQLNEKKTRVKEILSRYNAELFIIKENLSQLEDNIQEKNKYYINKIKYQNIGNWIEQIFVPSVEEIERHILQNINEEFNILFNKWFDILMTETCSDISIEIDENFTPLVYQNGYQSSMISLSGGEKTSVALAYRLSLNSMIKKISGINDSLLILDEPTDGFSKEQLIHVGKILKELDSTQVIIVSHERDLEIFVDKIFKIVKTGNISKLESTD